jgi:hypothetical protein
MFRFDPKPSPEPSPVALRARISPAPLGQPGRERNKTRRRISRYAEVVLVFASLQQKSQVLRAGPFYLSAATERSLSRFVA